MKLRQLQDQPFATEKELQTLIESNLHILDLYLIKSEMSLGNKRFDTVCLSENKEICVIEYKKARKDSQQSQVQNYATTLLNHTQQFINAVSSLHDAKKISDFAYSSSIKAISQNRIRKIGIAKDFDKYTLENDAENYRYYKYPNLLRLEKMPGKDQILLEIKDYSKRNSNIISDDYLLTLDNKNMMSYDVGKRKERVIIIDGKSRPCDNMLLELANALDENQIQQILWCRSISQDKSKLIRPIGNHIFVEGKLNIEEKMDIIFEIAEVLSLKVELVFA